MSDLYRKIEDLCKKRGVNVTQMCKESGASRASITDLKMGRKQALSSMTLSKIANYFNVSVDYLIVTEQKEKSPSKIGEGKHHIPDEETLKLLELLESRDDIRYLAAASQRATPEHVRATAKMFDELYGRDKDK